MKKVIIIFTLVSALYGCATMKVVQKDIKERDNNSKIVFIRPYNDKGFGAPTTIVEIGKKDNIHYVGKMYSGCGIVYSVEPGKHVFGISGGDIWTSFAVETVPKKFYFVHIYPTTSALHTNFKVEPINYDNLFTLTNLNHVKWLTPREEVARKYIKINANRFYRNWLRAVYEKNFVYMYKEDGFFLWMAN